MSANQQVTQILEAARSGDAQATEALLPLVYDELRRLARAKMAGAPPGQTLQPTALVHEAFLKLVGSEGPDWENRRHFFGAAAQAMREILVDQARRKASLKRGSDRKRVPIHEATPVIEPPAENVLALDEAVKKLESDDPRKGQIVNLRFFAGMSIEETAAALDLSVGTIKRELRYIKLWIYTQLTPESEARDAADGG